MSRLLARTLRVFVWTAAVLCLLDLALIKAPMGIARIHIKHLLADFQSIQPMQGNWADAQHLMRRWGRWGSYRGTCTPTDCTYTITVEDAISERLGQLGENSSGFVANHGIRSDLAHLGWHGVLYVVRFTVQDGVIVRINTGLMLNVSPHIVLSDWNQGYSLMLSTRVHSRLTVPPHVKNFGWILGGEGTPSDHPDYKVGRPGGCEICLSGELTYTPTLGHSEIVRLTSYDLSCITSWRQCTSLEDLLPAASEWHLYDYIKPNYKPQPDPPPQPCIVAPRALGRDADIAFEGDVLSIHTEQRKRFGTPVPYMQEVDSVRVVRILKGEPRFLPGQQIVIEPYAAEGEHVTYTAEHLHVGIRSILFFQGRFMSEKSPFNTLPCGILGNTPETLRDVIFGISQDVLSRHGDAWDN